jgi:glycosyltransferase involved in cell wall biosynthesis
MNVWLVTVGEPLPLPGSTARPWRTGLLAEVLRRRGHSVLWWTSTVDHFTKRFHAERCSRVPIAPCLDLQFLHGCMYERNISLKRLVNHWQIARQFRRLSTREPTTPDVILVSYPTIELSDEAVRFARVRGIPILIDVRDLWPDEMTARLPEFARPLAPWLLWPLYQRARRAVRGASGIIAISETYLNWARSLARRGALDSDLVSPLGYPTSSFKLTDGSAPGKRLLDLGVRPDRRIVWFCGTFVGSIDLSTAIEAARLLETEAELQFVFTGTGERSAEWQTQAEGLANVVFTGWSDREEIAWLSARAWVGLAAYRPGALMSLPNKIFEYMSAGLPIVSSLQGETRSLIEDYDIGATFEAGDGPDLANVLRGLAQRPEEIARKSPKARAIFRSRFSAELVYERLADHLESCARDDRAEWR